MAEGGGRLDFTLREANSIQLTIVHLTYPMKVPVLKKLKKMLFKPAE